MAGYLGQIGMRGEDAGSGFGLLARDTTALEENDRGWENLPPWGYKRNRPQDNAPPRSLEGATMRSTALSGWLEMSARSGRQAGWLERPRGAQGEWLELPARSRLPGGRQGEWLELPQGGRLRRGPQGEWLELPSGAKLARGRQGEWLELPRGTQSGHPTVLVQSRGQVSGLGSCCTGCAGGHGCISGLGDSNAAIEQNAILAASSIREAILSTGITGTSLEALQMPDYSVGFAYLAKVEDQNVAWTIQSYAVQVQNALQNILEYGDAPTDETRAIAQSAVGGLRAIAEGIPVEQITDASATQDAQDRVKAESAKYYEAPTLLQSLAMSDAGAGVITAGAFTAGVTGINKDAILDEAAGSDIDVGKLVKAGESARDSVLSMGKYAAYIGVAVVAYFAAKKAGVI